MESPIEAELADPQRLAFAYSPLPVRRLILPLLVLDGRLAGIVRRRGEPILAQMRLAWWRETLQAPRASWPAGEPLLAALSKWQDPSELSALAEGWECLLADSLDDAAITGFAAGRQSAFGALAAEIGEGTAGANAAARTWALADLAANLSEEGERSKVLALAGRPSLSALPRAMRTLAVLAALGARSIARGGRPLLEGRGAALTALRVGLLGR